MKTTNAVAQAIRKIVTEHFFINPEYFQLNRTFKNDFGFNSLEITELVVMIEQQFDINIPDQSLSTVRNVSDLITVTEQSFYRTKA